MPTTIAASSRRFQFTPLREGRRPSSSVWINARTLFQFTPLREGRRVIMLSICRVIKNFNSRPCVRGDSTFSDLVSATSNFNSRPCVRGDSLQAALVPVPVIFQFTPLREGRRDSFHFAFQRFYFNSRPCVRGDGDYSARCTLEDGFQFTPLREGRRIPVCCG